MANDIHQVIAELSTRQTVLELVQAELDRIGVAYTVDMAPEGFRLSLNTGLQLLLANLTEQAKRTPQTGWPALAASYVAHAMSQPKPPERLSTDELRAQVRARIVPDMTEEWNESHTYARPFAAGLTRVLCVDYPEFVATLTDEMIDELALPLETLWRYGQANTDAEPIDDRDDLGDGVHLLAGDSYYMASKVANFPALIRDFVGPSPCGVVFAVPDRATVLYSVVTPDDGLQQIMAICQIVSSVLDSTEIEHPGGILSTRVFYWAPDGSVEHVASPSCALVDGQETTLVFPSETFQRYAPLGGRAR